MANYYVDLSATSTGSGTIESPWNWLQFYADVSGTGGTVVGGDYIFLRGSKNITNSPSGNKSFKTNDNSFQIKLYAWSLSDYGPWSLYDSSNRISLNGVVEIDGGIIVSDYNRSPEEKASNIPTIMLYTSAIETSFIKSERIALRSFPESSANPYGTSVYGYCAHNYCGEVTRSIGISGATLVSDDGTNKALDIDLREPTILQFKDSLIYILSQNFQNALGITSVRTPVSAISAIWDWDVVPASNFGQLSGTLGIMSASNMQYGWNVPITWPSWSACQQDFVYLLLGKGITISGSGGW